MELAGEAGKETAALIQGKAEGIWKRVRVSFAGDAPSLEALDRFASDPDRHMVEVQAKVADKLSFDPALRDELAAAIAEVKHSAPRIRVVQRIEAAERIVGLKARRITRE